MEASEQRPRTNPGILEEVCRDLGIRLLVLFGSWAAGSPPPRSGSDVDLAAAFDRNREAPGYFDLLDALARAFPGEDVDPVRLADADPLFRWEILREGELLHGDPLEFLEYRAFAYRDFVDSEDLRVLERRLFEKKMDRVRERIRASA